MEKDLQNVVAKFFTKKNTEWYSAGIHKLISYYNNDLDEQNDYVEKWEILWGIQCCFEALSFFFFYQLCEQHDLTFEKRTFRYCVKISHNF